MAITGVSHGRQLHPDARCIVIIRRPCLIAGRIAALVKKPIDHIARGRRVAVSVVGGRSHVTVVTAFAIKRERSASGIHMLAAASGLPFATGRAVQRRDRCKTGIVIGVPGMGGDVTADTFVTRSLLTVREPAENPIRK